MFKRPCSDFEQVLYSMKRWNPNKFVRISDVLFVRSNFITERWGGVWNPNVFGFRTFTVCRNVNAQKFSFQTFIWPVKPRATHSNAVFVLAHFNRIRIISTFSIRMSNLRFGNRRHLVSRDSMWLPKYRTISEFGHLLYFKKLEKVRIKLKWRRKWLI